MCGFKESPYTDAYASTSHSLIVTDGGISGLRFALLVPFFSPIHTVVSWKSHLYSVLQHLPTCNKPLTIWLVPLPLKWNCSPICQQILAATSNGFCSLYAFSSSQQCLATSPFCLHIHGTIFWVLFLSLKPLCAYGFKFLCHIK